MPSLLSRNQHDAATPPSLTLPLALLIASFLAYVATPTRHALLTSAIAWLSICLYTTLRIGARSLLNVTHSQKLAWTAGGLLALAQVCERAVYGRGIWWAKALLPFVIYTLTTGGVFEESPTQSDSPPPSPTKSGPVQVYGSKSTLTIATASALVAVYAHYGSISVMALGMSYVVLEVLAFHLVERARAAALHQAQNGGSIIYSANGSLTQPVKPSVPGRELWMTILRDVSTAGAVVIGISALSLESIRSGGQAYYGLGGQPIEDHLVLRRAILSIVYALGAIAVHMTMFGALVLMLQRQGAFLTSFVPLAAAVCSELVLGFSLSRFWFAILWAGAAFSFLDEQDAFATGSRMKLRVGKILTLTAIVSFAALTLYSLRQPLQSASFGRATSETANGVEFAAPAEPLQPLQYTNKQVHPIESLVEDARASWKSKLQMQSQSLEAAVAEYKRRYGIPPPPHFDKWYEFAQRKGVQIIDDYDSIYHSLLPFWALPPATIRARAREALGFGDNQLMGLLIRDGRAVHIEAGPEWLQQAAVGMMEQFIEYLPDMDLAFNIHDEPRVVVPHDELSRLVEIALTENMPEANAQTMPKNSFSARPRDVSSGKRIVEAKTTRFSHYPHQATWVPSRLSCSLDSPARALDESLARDNLTMYAVGELGFIYNHTAFSDICNSPSFSSSLGFFDRPNAFNVVHELFPVFSQSKISSFQDILYPSPWYWFGKVEYKNDKDRGWEVKKNKLWWRGSTTGGFSRAGGWKRQHRQHFVRRVNALDTAKVMMNSNAAATDEKPGSEWIVKDVDRQDFQDMIDVHFSHIGQCDPGDCDAQREFFQIVDPADQQDAWKYKYLLDMDGNAFSGRFYAFLQSRSLPFKMAVFREWHEEWIRPWVHYIPLSLEAEEALEVVRYLDAEENGRALATSVAEAGRDWAGKALRNEDFEVWLFRLMLEYGRVIDDNRASIGFTGA